MGVGSFISLPGADVARCPVEYYGNPYYISNGWGGDRRNWYLQDLKLCKVVTEKDTKKCFEITNALGHVSFSFPICTVGDSVNPSCAPNGLYYNDVYLGPLDSVKAVRNTNAAGNNEIIWQANPTAAVHLACGPSDSQTFTCDGSDCSKIQVYVYTTNQWACQALAQAQSGANWS